MDGEAERTAAMSEDGTVPVSLVDLEAAESLQDFDLTTVYARGNEQLHELHSIDEATLLQALNAEFPERDTTNYNHADLLKIKLPDAPKENRPPRLFDVGMPVEIFGADAVWRKGRVARVIEQVRDDFDWELDVDPTPEDYILYYNVGDFAMLKEDELSLPMEFLVREFGLRPLLWQQWAMLRLEERLRFQDAHVRDFMELDATQFGTMLYDKWVEHPENADFKAVYATSPYKHYLEERMLHPFRLIDSQTDEGAAWNITEEENISVYTYLSILGSGGWMCLAVLFIQIAVPIALYLVSLEGPEARRFWESNFCSNEGDLVAKVLLFSVMLIYLIKVVPETISTFLRTAAALETPISRTISLRRTVWLQGDDTMNQRLGYALDVLLNTAYASLLYGLNIFILYNTDDPIDLLLNALAIEFVHTLDEEVANAHWWDEGRRYLLAGCVEMSIRSTLRVDLLKNARDFCAAFEIDEAAYQEALRGYRNKTLTDRRVAGADSNDVEWAVDDEDGWWIQLATLARRTQNDRAVAFFEGVPHTFEATSLRQIARGIYHACCPTGRRTVGSDIIFRRFYKNYVWSKWDRVMFLPAPPTRREKAKVDWKKLARKAVAGKAAASLQAAKSDDSLTIDTESVRNLRLKRVITDQVMQNIGGVLSVLSGYSIYLSMYNSAKRHERIGVLFSLVYGVLEWGAYVIDIIFPIVMCFAVVLVPLCY